MTASHTPELSWTVCKCDFVVKAAVCWMDLCRIMCTTGVYNAGWCCLSAAGTDSSPVSPHRWKTCQTKPFPCATPSTRSGSAPGGRCGSRAAGPGGTAGRCIGFDQSLLLNLVGLWYSTARNAGTGVWKWGHSLINSSGTVPGMLNFVGGRGKQCWGMHSYKLGMLVTWHYQTNLFSLSEHRALLDCATPSYYGFSHPVCIINPSSLTWLRWNSTLLRDVLLKGPGLCQGAYIWTIHTMTFFLTGLLSGAELIRFKYNH